MARPLRYSCSPTEYDRGQGPKHWFAAAGTLRQTTAHTVPNHTAFCVGMHGYVLRLDCEIPLTGLRGSISRLISHSSAAIAGAARRALRATVGGSGCAVLDFLPCFAWLFVTAEQIRDAHMGVGWSCSDCVHYWYRPCALCVLYGSIWGFEA
jgi:hypothetical protein